MSDLIRPRSVTEIVDAAFQLYRRAPVEMMTACAIIYVPYLVAQLLVLGGQPPSIDNIGRLLALAPLSILVKIAMDAPLLWLASELYLGRPATAMDACRAALPRLPRLIVASILRFVILFVAFLFLIIPSIVMWAMTFAVGPAIVLEGVGVNTAFTRSQKLSSGLKWHILAATFLAAVIMYVVVFGATAMTLLTGSVLLQQIVQAAAMIVVYPVVAATLTVLYYDARIRREGFDVEWMSRGGDPAAAAEPSPAP